MLQLLRRGFMRRQHIPPSTHVWQLFVYDPNGVTFEMSFDGSNEQGPAPTRDNGPWYVADEDFSTSRSRVLGETRCQKVWAGAEDVEQAGSPVRSELTHGLPGVLTRCSGVTKALLYH